ncbi:Seipin [Aphelenchoides besseyi]|nr:Seipin [Aphelenchoides besseyi]
MQTISDLTGQVRLVWRHANISPETVFVIVFQLISISCFSFIVPFVIRSFIASPMVEADEPLEFVFHTCPDKLHGICSFPEAEVNFYERNLNFHGGYRYSFILTVEFEDIEVARGTGVFMAQVDVQDEQSQSLMELKKTVRVPSGGLYEKFINMRNFFFWPLYMVGILGDGGISQMRIEFPNVYREAFIRPARFLVVQIQNRFLMPHFEFMLMSDYPLI